MNLIKVFFFFQLFFFFVNNKSFAQDKYICKTGHVYFISHTDIIDIDADNYNLASILNAKNGEVIFMIPMRGFKFKLPLAEEHFNENYVESDKYPQAKFKGKFINFDKIDFSKEGQQYIEVEGEMTIHGQTKKIKEAGILEIKNGEINAKSVMKIALKDYGINIPSLVINKVADIIDIKINLKYEPYTK